MSRSPFHKILSVLLIVIILCASTAGLCHETHAAGDLLCQQCDSQVGSSFVKAVDAGHHSCPDADHSESDHCATACYCSCHLPVAATGIEFAYSLVITDHFMQQIFNPPQEIFLSLFVPPDNPA